MSNQLIVLSGPSGVGKGTIVQRLLQKGGYALSVSCTTRDMRVGEEEGKSYFFITKEKFESLIKENGFLEYSNHFGNYYGTPAAFVKDKLKTHDVILEIEVDGALQIKKAYPKALLIMILPPDENALRARLKGRGTESDERIEERIKRYNYELSKKGFYDFAVINGDLDKAVAEIENIINSKKELKHD